MLITHLDIPRNGNSRYSDSRLGQYELEIEKSSGVLVWNSQRKEYVLPFHISLERAQDLKDRLELPRESPEFMVIWHGGYFIVDLLEGKLCGPRFTRNPEQFLKALQKHTNTAGSSNGYFNTVYSAVVRTSSLCIPKTTERYRLIRGRWGYLVWHQDHGAHVLTYGVPVPLPFTPVAGVRRGSFQLIYQESSYFVLDQELNRRYGLQGMTAKEGRSLLLDLFDQKIAMQEPTLGPKEKFRLHNAGYLIWNNEVRTAVLPFEVSLSKAKQIKKKLDQEQIVPELSLLEHEGECYAIDLKAGKCIWRLTHGF